MHPLWLGEMLDLPGPKGGPREASASPEGVPTPFTLLCTDRGKAEAMVLHPGSLSLVMERELMLPFLRVRGVSLGQSD